MRYLRLTGLMTIAQTLNPWFLLVGNLANFDKGIVNGRQDVWTLEFGFRKTIFDIESVRFFTLISGSWASSTG